MRFVSQQIQATAKFVAVVLAVCLLQAIALGQGVPGGGSGGPPAGGGGGTTGGGSGNPVGYFWRSHFGGGGVPPTVNVNEFSYEGPSCAYSGSGPYLNTDCTITFGDDEAAAVLDAGEEIEVTMTVAPSNIQGTGANGPPAGDHEGEAALSFSIGNGFQILSGDTSSVISANAVTRTFQLKATGGGNLSVGCAAAILSTSSYAATVTWVPEPPKYTENPHGPPSSCGCKVCIPADGGNPGMVPILAPDSKGGGGCSTCEGAGGVPNGGASSLTLAQGLWPDRIVERSSLGPAFFSNYDYSVRLYRIVNEGSTLTEKPNRFRAFLFDPTNGESVEFFNIDAEGEFTTVKGEGYSNFSIKNASGQAVDGSQLEDLTDYTLSVTRKIDGLKIDFEVKNASSQSNGSTAPAFDGRVTQLKYPGETATTFTYQAQNRGSDPELQLLLSTIDDGLGVVVSPTYTDPGMSPSSGRYWESVEITGYEVTGPITLDYTYSGEQLASVSRDGFELITYAFSPATDNSGNNVMTWESKRDWSPNRLSSMVFTGEYESSAGGVYNQYAGVVVQRMDGSGFVYSQISPSTTEGMYDIVYRSRTIEWVPRQSVRYGSESSFAAMLNSTEEELRLGRPRRYSDSTGYVVDYDYDANGNRTRTTHPDGSYELTLHDDEARLIYSRDREGFVTVYQRDSEGRVFRQIDGVKDNNDAVDNNGFMVPSGAKPLQTVYGFNGNGLVSWMAVDPYVSGPVQTPAVNTRTDYQYHADNRLKKVIKPLPAGQTARPSVQYTWNGPKLASLTNERGSVTLYQYDTYGRVLSIDYGGGASGSEQYWYKDDARILYQKDRSGVVSKTIFDTAWRPQAAFSAYKKSDSLWGAGNNSGEAQYLQEFSDSVDTSIPFREWTRYIYTAGHVQPRWEMRNEGLRTFYLYDYRGRRYRTARYPRNGAYRVVEDTYFNNLLVSTKETISGSPGVAYARKTFRGYSNDRQTVRIIRTRASGITSDNSNPPISFENNNSDIFNVTRIDRHDLNRNYEITDAVRDLRGNIISLTDEYGTETFSQYDEHGRKTMEVRAHGTSLALTSTMEYDEEGRMFRTTNPAGTVTELEFDDADNIKKSTLGAGTSMSLETHYTYDPDGVRRTVTAPSTAVTETIRQDCCGRSVGTKDGLGHGSIVNSDAGGRPVHRVQVADLDSHADYFDPVDSKILSESTTRYYDNGQVQFRTRWKETPGAITPNGVIPIAGMDGVSANKGVTTQYLYDSRIGDNKGLDSAGGMIARKLDGGDQAVNIQAALSKLAEPVANGGAGIAFISSRGGSASIIIAPDEKTMQVSVMDSIGRNVMSALLGGPKASNVNDLIDWSCTLYEQRFTVPGTGFGLMESVVRIDSDGNTTQSFLDGYGNNAGSMDQLGNITKQRNGPKGQPRYVYNAQNKLNRYVYDILGRKVTMFDELNRKSRITYDTAGRVSLQYDPKNKNTLTQYDVLGRAWRVRDRNGKFTTRYYDSAGRISKLRDAQAKETLYEYDILNRRTLATYPDTSAEETEYDAAGRVERMTLPSGREKVSIYKDPSNAADIAGVLRRVEYFEGNGTAAGVDTFSYDEFLRSNGSTSRDGVLTGNTYTDRGQLKTESTTYGGQTYTTTYDYDSRGRRKEISYPGNRKAEYTFEERGLVDLIKWDGVQIEDRNYDTLGRLTGVARPSVNESRNYFNDNRVKTISNAAVGTLSYAYDLNGNKKSETWNGNMSSWSFTTVKPGSSWADGYDHENRFMNFVQAGQSIELGRSNVGNISNVNLNGNNSARLYSDAHELTSVGGVSQAFDDDGNMTQAVNGNTYTWDVAGLMESAVSGSKNTEYGYDANGKRVWKKVVDGSNITETVFVYAGPNCIAEYLKGTSSPRQQYVHSGGIDSLILIDRFNGTASPAQLTVTRNQQRSVTALVDFSGNVVERYTYDLFGKRTILASNGSTVRAVSHFTNPYGYTSRRHDAETGKIYFRWRQYDEETGEFASRDPLKYRDGMSQYRGYFVLIGVDPMGNQLIRLGDHKLPNQDLVRGLCDQLTPTAKATASCHNCSKDKCVQATQSILRAGYVANKKTTLWHATPLCNLIVSEKDAFGGYCHAWNAKFTSNCKVKARSCLSQFNVTLDLNNITNFPYADHVVSVVKNSCSGKCLIVQNWPYKQVVDPCQAKWTHKDFTDAGLTAWNLVASSCGCKKLKRPVPPFFDRDDFWDPDKNPGILKPWEPKM